jgi:hypothetical protein
MTTQFSRLFANRKLYVKEEACSGDPAFGTTTVTVAEGTVPVIEPTFTPNFGRVENQIARPSIGRQNPRGGLNTGTFNFGVEVTKGKGSVTVEPPWARFMRASGFQQRTLRSVDVTGAIEPAVVSGQTAGGKNVLKQGLKFVTLDNEVTGRIAFTDYGNSTATRRLYFWDEGELAPYSSADQQATADTFLRIDAPGTDYHLARVAISSSVSVVRGLAYVPSSRPVGQMAFADLTTDFLTIGETLTGQTSGAIIRVLDNPPATATGTLQFDALYRYPEVGETMVAGDGDTLTVGTLTQAAHSSLTMGIDEAGLFNMTVGTRCSWTFNATAGEVPRFDVTAQGIFTDNADTLTALQTSAASLEGEFPPRFVSAEINLGAGADATESASDWVPLLSSVQIQLGSGLTIREDATAAEGARDYQVSTRELSGSIDPEAVSNAVFDVMGKGKLATEFPFRLQWGTGTPAGNRFRIQADRAIFESVASQDRTGKLAYGANLRFGEEIANDDIVIAVGSVA